MRATFTQLWWVVLCVALCFGFYAHGAHKKRTLIRSLQGDLKALQSEKEWLAQEKEELLLNIQSERDPAWVEMTLIKVLGLVPEGKVKVYFTPSLSE